jgi:hypothetical protein
MVMPISGTVFIRVGWIKTKFTSLTGNAGGLIRQLMIWHTWSVFTGTPIVGAPLSAIS